MYHIYLDETHRLASGAQEQILILAGFGTGEPKKIAKLFHRIKWHTLPKRLRAREIKSSDMLAERIRPRLLKNLLKTNIDIYAIYQHKKALPFYYFTKNKLNYDQLYLDLLIILLKDEWDTAQESEIIITLDEFRPGKMEKKEIVATIEEKLKSKYPEKHFQVLFGKSHELLTLQVADFICGAFNWALSRSTKWLSLIESKVRKIIGNPLQIKPNEKKPRT